jgi:hypothetical protein
MSTRVDHSIEEMELANKREYQYHDVKEAVIKMKMEELQQYLGENDRIIIRNKVIVIFQGDNVRVVSWKIDVEDDK